MIELPDANLPDSYSLHFLFDEIKALLKAKKDQREIVEQLQEKFRLNEAQAIAAFIEFHQQRDAGRLRTAKIWLAIDALAVIALFVVFLTGSGFPAIGAFFVLFGPMVAMLLMLMLSWLLINRKRKPEPYVNQSTSRSILTSEVFGLASLMFLVLAVLVALVAYSLDESDDSPSQTSRSLTEPQVLFWDISDVEEINDSTTRLSGSIQNTQEFQPPIDTRTIVQQLRWEWRRP